MRLPTISGEFRVGRDPELRFTPSGKSVCSVSLICTESKKTETGWEDGDSTPWITASIWGLPGEEVAETIRQGQRVLVTGQLFARDYETREGEKRQSIEIKWATVAAIPGGLPKAERQSASAGYSDDPWTTPQAGGQAKQNVPADPWAVPHEEPQF